MATFGLGYPLFQAAPGGEALAIAIARTGGMGAVSLSWSSPEEAYASVTRLKKLFRESSTPTIFCILEQNRWIAPWKPVARPYNFPGVYLRQKL